MRKHLLHWVPLIAWASLISALSSIAASNLDSASASVDRTTSISFLTNPWFVHPVEYAVLAILVVRVVAAYALRRGALLWTSALAITVAYGVGDELHQSFVPGRSASLHDVGFDALGALGALLVAAVISMVWRRARRRP